MNTLLKVREIKIIALMTAISFSLSLVQFPVASASEPVADETGVPVPTVPVESATAPSTTIPQDPTSAFLTEEPLSVPINPEPLPIEPVPCDGCELPIPEEPVDETEKDTTISRDPKASLGDEIYELPPDSDLGIVIIGDETDTSNIKIEPAKSPISDPYTKLDPSKTVPPPSGDPSSYPLPSPDPSELETRDLPEDIDLPLPGDDGIQWGVLPEPDLSGLPDSDTTGVGGGITVESTVVPVEQEPVPTPYLPPTPEEQFAEAAKALVISDLVNSFGFSKEMLDDLIKQGLIKFEADYQNLRLTVFIDPSVKLPDGAVNLTDLLGSNKLPEKINYQLGLSPIQPAGPCYIDANGTSSCPLPSYQLEHGSFRIGKRFVDLDYLERWSVPDCDGDICPHYTPPLLVGDNRLHSVKIYDVDDPCQGNPACLAPITTKLIKEISYKYDDEAKSIQAHIVYYDGSQGDVVSRDVTLTKMEDGQYHIQTVTDYDKDGKVLANSKFNYTVLHTGGGRGPIGIGVSVVLDNITRTDADGKLLSTITDIHPAITIQIIGREPLYRATIMRPDNTSVRVFFRTLEELFLIASIVERIRVDRAMAPTEPADIEAYLDQIAGLLDIDGDGVGNALTDGILIVRYLLGWRGDDLIDGAVSPDATLSTEEIEAYLEGLVNAGVLDIDGDQQARVTTDGVLIIRYLFGFRGDVLVAGIVPPEPRDTAEEIEAFLNMFSSLMDVDGDGVAHPLGDGIMIVRYLLGWRGNDLIDGAVSPDATRSTEEIEAYLEQLLNSGILDVDGDGDTHAGTDGYIIIAYLAEFRGDTLLINARAFDVMDQNDDGALTLSEVLPVITLVTRMWRGTEPFDPAYDLNGNGQIDADEVTRYGSIAAQFLPEISQAMSAFGVMDQNGDYVLTLGEALPVVILVTRMWRGTAPFDPAYDLDGDGQISISEATLYSAVAAILVDRVGDAMRIFELIDANDDGDISIAEGLSAYFIAGRMAAGLIPFDPAYDTNGDGQMTIADWVFFGVVANLSWTEQEIVKANRARPIFELIDVDDDGDISVAEGLLAWYKAGRMAAALEPFDPAYDTNGDGRMTTVDWIFFGVVANMFWSDEEQAHSRLLQRAFNVLGGEGDGQITVLEAIPVLAAVHAAIGTREGDPGYNSAYDTDGDHQITQADMDIFVETAHTFIDHDRGSIYLKAYEILDQNGDYVLTPEEIVPIVVDVYWVWKGEKEYNPLYDLTGDGRVDGTDLNRFLSIMRSMEDSVRVIRLYLSLRVLNLNRDTILTAQETIEVLSAIVQAKDSRVGDPRYNQAYDVDLDGVITQADLDIFRETARTFMNQENNQTLHAFEVMDTNHDYKITVQEKRRTLKEIEKILAGRAPYNALYDVNGDGKVDREDYAIFTAVK